jgi:hypothetical protein
MNSKRDRRCGVVSLTVGLVLLVFGGCGKQNCTDGCSKNGDCYDGLICLESCTSLSGMGTCTPRMQCVPKECAQCANSCSFTEAIGSGTGDSDSCSAGTCQ